MYVSGTLLNQAWEKYKKNQSKYGETNEGYSGGESAGAGAAAAFDAFFLVLAIIFFILEVVVLVYGIIIAINCTTGGAERIVHVVLAIAFTFPYVLIMAVFNDCAKTVLKGGKPVLNVRGSEASQNVETTTLPVDTRYSTFNFGGGDGGCSACSINKV